MTTVEFELNGQAVIVDDVAPHCTLLEWLRASGRTGAKEGCAEGECGACAVAFISVEPAGHGARGAPRVDAVNSCLVPLADAHGRVLVSVEGVSASPQHSVLHPVQAALVQTGGSQCGYCTPGFVVSAFAEYYRPGRAGYDPEALAGNLCRCTGYRPIIEAARLLGPPAASDPWLARLAKARSLPALEPGAGSFQRPGTLAAVFELLAEQPDALLLAGGTDVMVEVNQRGLRPPALISLAAVPELSQLLLGERELVIGAALSLSALERALHAYAVTDTRLLRELWPLFSSRLIRNRATLGGNLATASPIGDAAPVLLALEAEVSLASASGTRRLPLADFFLGYRKTALAPGELIVALHVARGRPPLQRFYKVSKRATDDISSVSAAFALELDAAGRVERLRVAYGGVAAVPLRARELERFAQGRAWDEATLRGLQQVAGSLGTPLSDHRASAAYRQAMLGSLLARFFAETASDAARAATRSGGAP